MDVSMSTLSCTDFPPLPPPPGSSSCVMGMSRNALLCRPSMSGTRYVARYGYTADSEPTLARCQRAACETAPVASTSGMCTESYHLSNVSAVRSGEVMNDCAKMRPRVLDDWPAIVLGGCA